MKPIVITILALTIACGANDRAPIEGTDSFDQFFGATEDQTNAYRSVQEAIESGELPRIEDISVEGALTAHNIREEPIACDALLCTNSEQAVAPSLIAEKDVVWVRDRLTTGVETKTRPPTDVVIALDTSSIMIDLPGTTAAANAILAELREGDRFAIVTFTDTATVFQEPVEATSVDRLEVMEEVSKLRPEGLDDLNVGLEKSYELLNEMGSSPDRIRRVVIFTCGYPHGVDLSASFDTTLGASSQRIGTTLVGVLLPYDQTIADRYHAIPGANYFAAHNLDALRVFFSTEFVNYAAPIAYDVNYRFGSGVDHQIGAVYGNASGDGLTFSFATAYPTERRGAVIARLETSNPTTFQSNTTFAYMPDSSRGYADPVNDVTPLSSTEPSRAFSKSIALVNSAEVMKAALNAREAGDVEQAREMLDELSAYLSDQSKALDDEGLAEEAARTRKLSGLL